MISKPPEESVNAAIKRCLDTLLADWRPCHHLAGYVLGVEDRDSLRRIVRQVHETAGRLETVEQRRNLWAAADVAGHALDVIQACEN